MHPPMQVAMLSQERDALATNISSLYNTAKLEMQRKDGEIKELRQRCASLETAMLSARCRSQ